MEKLKKHTLLLGEGIHQHTLYGEFKTDRTNENDFRDVIVTQESELRHEKPNHTWSNEHKTLIIDKGSWRMGKQVEFNPFNQSVSRVWD
jgi:hypothetical protein